jgi:hypothetical protein
MTNGNRLETDSACFADRFRRLRLQHAGKQMVLVASGLRCTDAAVSSWENGRRLPSWTLLSNAIQVFVRLGAAKGDLEHLRAAWARERAQNRGIGRDEVNRDAARQNGGHRKVSGPRRRIDFSDSNTQLRNGPADWPLMKHV